MYYVVVMMVIALIRSLHLDRVRSSDPAQDPRKLLQRECEEITEEAEERKEETRRGRRRHQEEERRSGQLLPGDGEPQQT